MNAQVKRFVRLIPTKQGRQIAAGRFSPSQTLAHCDFPNERFTVEPMANDFDSFASHMLPLPVRLTNWVGHGLSRLGIQSELSSGSILASAQHRLRSTNGIDEPFREALAVLAQSLETEAQLSPFGRMLSRGYLQSIVEKRIALANRVAREASIVDRPIERPLFVVGLPRTGTTLLHNLLSCDPESRALRTWELTFSPRQINSRRPLPDHPGWILSRLLGWANEGLPGLKQVHPIAAENYEECTLLLMNSLISLGFLLLAPLPGYARWYYECDEARRLSTYRLHKLQLQILAGDAATGHWVLKAPVHLDGLAELLTVYPDAQVVLTERDPATAVASTCSLFAVVRSAMLESIDRRKLGPEVGDLLGQAVERAAGVRQRFANRIFTVSYEDLTARPLETLGELYQRMNRSCPSAMIDGMKRWLQNNPRHKHGVHRYDGDEFGFDAEAWRRRFGDAYAALFPPRSSSATGNGLGTSPASDINGTSAPASTGN